MKLYGDKSSYLTKKVLLTAEFCNAKVDLVQVGFYDAGKDEVVKKSPCKNMPYMETPNGLLAESNACSIYIAKTSQPAFLGTNDFEFAQYVQWSDFASINVHRVMKSIIFPIFGWQEYNTVREVDQKEIADAQKSLNKYMTTLNTHLEGKKFLVGNNYTLADVTMFVELRHFFQLIFVKDFRNKVLGNVTRWFTEMSMDARVVKVFGLTQLCSVGQKAPKVEKPVEVKKVAEVKVAAVNEDGEVEEKKKRNPLELLPPTTFVMDDFKKDFLNTKDKRGALDRFWANFDANGFSFYFLQYQNLPSEGKVLFKTNNSCSFFLQKLDTFRKWTFSTYGVYGVEGEYVCRGVWMWRGLDIPEEVREHDNFAYMTIKKLDSVKDRAYIEEYWMNIEEDQTVDGLKVAEVVYFK